MDVVEIVIGAQGLHKVGQGETLSRALFRLGHFVGEPLCAGLGRCGRCRVRFVGEAPEPLEAERRRLTPGELAAGWRLSCLRPAASGLRLEVPARPAGRIAVAPKAPVSGPPLALAVDLGTTGVAWRAFRDGRVAAEGGRINPQVGAGGEVVSRLAFAAEPEGAAYLRGLVVDLLREAAAGLPGGVGRAALSGNPAMVCILCDRDLRGLSAAPYRLPWRGGEDVILADDLPPFYVPPLAAPFIGADVVAGLIHILATRNPPFPFLLADLGTNGECVLALGEDRFLAASAPMGPALEGVGLSCGAVASPGAAVSFSLSPGGLVPRLFEDGPGPAVAISGTGCLSLLARLLSVGALDETGRFTPEAPGRTPLRDRVLAGLGREAGEPRLEVGAVFLRASDVEEALKVKAAFNLVVSALLAEAGLGPGALGAVYLAGALGLHADGADLEALGFLPPGLAGRTLAVGNSSLDGTGLLLLRPEARQAARRAADAMRILDLTAAAAFQTAFSERMVFRHVP